MSALEQVRNRKTVWKTCPVTRKKLRLLNKILLPVSVENIGFSRNVLGKTHQKLLIAYQTPGNAHG